MNTESSNFINYTKQNSDTTNTSLFSLLKDCDIRISRLLELIENGRERRQAFPSHTQNVELQPTTSPKHQKGNYHEL